jgi:hypothetical protein
MGTELGMDILALLGEDARF